MKEEQMLFLNSGKPMPKSLKLAIYERAKMIDARKGVLLQETGEVCTQLYLIEKGVLCCYDIDQDTHKGYCVWIMMENDIVTCVNSFNNEVVSTETVLALEDCILWTITRQDFKELTAKYNAFEKIRQQFTDKYHIQSRNIEAQRKRPPEQFFEYLARTNEQLTTRIPNKHLASFMGIRESTLYEIKRKRRER
jgi:CRP-like cAMP-binding protein